MSTCSPLWPEHGVRGDVHAGDKVDNANDSSTGLPVYSLYGKTRKPTPEMLKDIDVLVYDIQDIGCRSFTYISTMGVAMEAAAENNKEFIVLDRPNPIGGLKIEGNVVEDGYISFVSQFKIPYLYGLTCGELALMLNGEQMLSKPCNLHVVKMKGWKRKMDYVQTGLQWIPSSPHIPHPHSAFFYPVSGILGELGYMSIGVGYTIPFQMFAAPWVEAEKLADNLNRLHLPGVIFRPMHLKPFYSVGKEEHLQGVQVHIVDFNKASLSEIQFYVMQEVTVLIRIVPYSTMPIKSASICSISSVALKRYASASVNATVGKMSAITGTKMSTTFDSYRKSTIYINKKLG